MSVNTSLASLLAEITKRESSSLCLVSYILTGGEYRPSLQLSSHRTDMQAQCPYICVVSIGHFIYAVGGYDSHSQLRSVERYNTEQNVWEYMSPMLHPRSALSASVLDGKIWVFGGYDGNEFLSSVEVYDAAQNAWVKTTVMPCGKSGHAVVTSREPVAAIAAASGSEASDSNAK
ncbi:unnamed protein product [Hymenolepis diminuta]|uniref:Uncharacterized protein n=1 Tax=Hymenolepis diminuta TaxID=6216 RepID=A0A564YKQ0_HYMDI|nr:unnamed protein product [Hymenolepis diminuta]